MFIAMYDENDNIVRIFENRKECADYFQTSLKCIDSFFSNVKHGRIENKKRDKNDGKLYKLYRYQKDDLEEVK